MPRRFAAVSVGYVPPDGATRNFVYNTASDVTQYTDENGSVHANTFDPLGRKTQCLLTLATGVIGTTKQTFQFDGLSRMTQASDFISTTEAKVDLYYDSLGRVLEDSQVYGGNTRNATQHAFESHPAVGCTFPQGRHVTNSYDLLYRRNQTTETSGGANIVAWEFFGPSRTAEWELGSGMYGTHLNNARTRSAIQVGESTPAWGDQSSDRLGYDGAGRLITKRYLDTTVNGTTHVYDSTTALAGQTTAYDKGSNKLYERLLQAESRSSLYQPIDDNGNIGGGYDSINRLLQYQRGTLKSTGGLNGDGGGEITTAISLPGTDTDRDYDLDGLGNWKKTVYTPVAGTETTEKRQHNYLNQITKLGSTEFSYDDSGNLLDDGTRKYEWDAFNRLTKVYKTPSTPVLIGEYTYDGLGRRIRKVITNGGLSGTITNGTTDYVYHQGIAQCCEERNGSNSPTKQYVWGHYIDELIQMLEDPNGTPVERYLFSDTLYRSMCLISIDWAIVEAYDTDAYGNTLIYSAAGTGGDWWADDAVTTDESDNEFIFTGRRYDPESEVFFFRARYYAPEAGRFICKDSLNYIDGMNLYRAYFVPMGIDPSGNGEFVDGNPIGIWTYFRARQPCGEFYFAYDEINQVPGIEDDIARAISRASHVSICFKDCNSGKMITIAKGRGGTSRCDMEGVNLCRLSRKKYNGWARDAKWNRSKKCSDMSVTDVANCVKNLPELPGEYDKLTNNCHHDAAYRTTSCCLNYRTFDCGSAVKSAHWIPYSIPEGESPPLGYNPGANNRLR